MLIASSALAEPSVTILPLGFEVTQFRGPSSRAAAIAPSTDGLRADRSMAERPGVVVWGQGGGAVLTLMGREIAVRRLGTAGADIAVAEKAAGAIPDSRLETAGAVTASLIDPVRDYDHQALGSRVHAKTLAISERKPLQVSSGAQAVPTDRTRIEAGPGAVFEDREPRLVAALAENRPAILVVKSYAERGAALAVVAKREGGWRVVAETPPVGEAQRWLNPAAVADFLGTGTPQIALVRTPHGDGILQVWALNGDRLELKAEKAGYANHAFGQPAQDLAAAIDLDGDGRPELAVPTLDRAAVAILSFRDGIREIARIGLPAKVASGLAVLGSGRDLHVLAGLEDGRVADIRP